MIDYLFSIVGWCIVLSVYANLLIALTCILHINCASKFFITYTLSHKNPIKIYIYIYFTFNPTPFSHII